MPDVDLNPRDLTDVAARGVTEEEVRRQIALLRRPGARVRLDRPATRGDGIRVLTPEEVRDALDRFEEVRLAGGAGKFVPASGAATRMFRSLIAARGGDLSLEAARAAAARGDGGARDLVRFAEGIRSFPFLDDLAASLGREGIDAGRLVREGAIGPILDHLLAPDRLGYAGLPKGLLKFHRYPDGSRTALEEQLLESPGFLADRDGVCRIHLTVSPEHLERFEAHLREILPSCERRSGARFETTFSVQKPSTDTVAVDPEGRPFRTEEGGLLFRPGGHGALIENLNDLRGEIVFVKNIDNVPPDRLKEAGVRWKRILGGHLAGLREDLHRHLRALRREPAPAEAVEAAARFARERLGLEAAPRKAPSTEAARDALLARLDRPIRVCGMVENRGEPGGGPFWVRSEDGSASLQIVERAQVEEEDPEQAALLAAATHFNGVDLACGLRDPLGSPYDLRKFVDPEAVFIARKSEGGRPLLALERPGLWNGGMAGWITQFVEVPAETFNPVKTVFDLLRPEHQA